MSLRKFAACLALTSFVLGGAADAGKLKITSTTFGWNPFTQSTTAGGTGPLGAFPPAAVNQTIEVGFSKSISKKSVKANTVAVKTVPGSVLAGLGITPPLPGGQIAPVEVEVVGNKIRIKPITLFIGTSIAFGFVENGFYQVELKGGKNGLKGGKDTLQKSLIITFRTTSQLGDPKAGAPFATVLIDDVTFGTKSLTSTIAQNPVASPSGLLTETQPPPSLRIQFDEPIVPSSVLNAASGVSPSILVQLDQDNVPTTVGDRIALPGTFALSQTPTSAEVEFKPIFASIPSDRLYVVTVKPTVQDLLGNSVFSLTGDIGAVTVFAFKTKNTGVVPVAPITETFAGQAKLDTEVSSADWAKTTPGLLKAGVGGGTGADGVFAPVSDTVLPTAEFDSGLGMNVPRIYNFQSVSIDTGITVSATGEFPLIIFSTGPVTINGTLDVGGASGQVFSENSVTPGAQGLADLGSTSGGRGGSMTDGVNLNTPLFGGTPTGYKAAVLARQGLGGLTTALSDFQLTKSGGVAFTAQHVGLWIQPNVGTGSSVAGSSPGNQIIHNHPSFQIQSVTNANTLVVSDEFGPLTQQSLDLYELPAPPIAKPGDPYVFGDLRGHDGEARAFAATAGGGSMGLAVAQSFITQVRAGGGGGGGSRYPGSDGEDAPNIGSASGTEGGTGGAGFVTGTVASKTDTTLGVTGTPFTGLDLDGGADPAIEPPFVVFPDISSPLYFEVASSTANSLTILPIDIDPAHPLDLDHDGVLDLSDMTALVPGDSFRLEPSFFIGGSGGGGSGVHCGNSTKLTAAPNLTMPTWTPGAGGGAGGGSLIIESTKRIAVGVEGKIDASGGDGGRTTGSFSVGASGGGGGGGGSVLLRSADTSSFAVRCLGVIDADGGSGGASLVDGGKGGGGRLRFEAINSNLSPASFTSGGDSTVFPELTATDLGTFIPQDSPSLGQSMFYFSGVLAPIYTSFTITYNATIDGVVTEGLTYTDIDAANNVEAPFTISFNDAGILPNGNIDPNTIDNVFDADIANMTGQFLRFRIVLQPEVLIGAQLFKRVQIDTVQIEIST